jgi:hypothetical protein
MKKKIIGIFVIMLMIATVVPASGIVQESEHKNSVLNHGDHWIGIGFITNLTDLGDGLYTFNCICFLYWWNIDMRHGIHLYHSYDLFYSYFSGFRYFGRHFAFLCCL